MFFAYSIKFNQNKLFSTKINIFNMFQTSHSIIP